jgi:acetyl-CoA carboxylase carboxyl transferase subunit alpha
MEYLDFEYPLKELEDQLAECKLIGDKTEVDVSETCNKLLKKIDSVKLEIYKNISPWQRVQLSRHPSRPYTLDYINALTNGSFLELHGDRNIGDDKAMIGGFGKINDQSFLFIGQQKGYRKALRLMKSAEKFKIPIVTLIDTPGAFPGLEAEERGQGEAIARNIFEMFNIKTQIISIVIGEGASGGALGIAIGDHVMMLENTWYSVISPESCSSILWRSWDFKEKAAEALKLTPNDMKKNKLIDKIIPEPLGGAHNDRDKVFKSVKKAIINSFNLLSQKKVDDLINERMNKFTSMGVFDE